MDTAALKNKILQIIIAAPIVMGLCFFLPAGTLNYWQAWVFTAILIIPMLFVMSYFLKHDPEFLERRLKTRETEAKQQQIIKVGLVIFLIGFILPGFDIRFGWSNVPPEISLAADLIAFLSYMFIFLVFRENSYAGRTIEVEKGQKVISTGPYSIIRHPMYLGTMFMYLAMPIALGSYVAVIPMLLYTPLLIFRILNEEEVLGRDLPGYAEYCKKTKYRLIPFIW
jgi:protein-S-isoprenylcysteine O-methyltransferase Ste14